MESTSLALRSPRAISVTAKRPHAALHPHSQACAWPTSNPGRRFGATALRCCAFPWRFSIVLHCRKTRTTLYNWFKNKYVKPRKVGAFLL